MLCVNRESKHAQAKYGAARGRCQNKIGGIVQTGDGNDPEARTALGMLVVRINPS